MPIWKDIENYETLYQVSDEGMVRRLYSDGSFRELKIIVGNHGYPMVNLSKQGMARVYLIHRLVAAAFIGPCKDKDTVNHKDWNRTNNSVHNLEYMSNAENLDYKNPDRSTKGDNHWSRRLPELVPRGDKHSLSKITSDTVRQIRHIHNTEKITQRELAERFGTTTGNVNAILRRKSWKHID